MSAAARKQKRETRAAFANTWRAMQRNLGLLGAILLNMNRKAQAERVRCNAERLKQYEKTCVHAVIQADLCARNKKL